jgi:UDP-GlcNAc:undecaprenyl-phosphate GlcNAc-1-phosphate transferase
MKTYFVITSAFLVTFFAVPVFRWLAIKSGILDLPGGRKIHKIATPLLGGVAIYFGFIIATILGLKDPFFFLPLLSAATAILILGLINDIRPLSAKTRFFYQLLAALALIFTGVRISFLPGGYLGDSIEVLITALWLVGVTNAYNYLDGLDGLASGSAAINLFCFAIILYATKQYALGRLALILAAAALGFLPYNFLKKGKIFLGEAGSTFLGFMLAGIAIIGNWAEDNVVKLSIPILILGVPIFDMIFTTIIRVKEKKVKNLRQWLEYSDRDHFHYSLVELGLRPSVAVIFIYLITLSMGISAIMVSNDVAIEGFLSLFQASIIISVIAVLIVIGKKHQNGWGR